MSRLTYLKGVIIIVIIIIIIINAGANWCRIKANHSRKDYIFQKYLCKNTAELLQEENMKKVNVPEAHIGACQLSMMDLFAKIVKDF